MAKLRVSFVKNYQVPDNALTLETIKEWLQQKTEESARIYCPQPPYTDETGYQVDLDNRSLCWKTSVDSPQMKYFTDIIYLELQKEKSILFGRTRNLDFYIEYNQ